MKLCIVWERDDGTVCVTHPCPQAKRESETDEQFAERIIAKDVPAGRPLHVQRKADLPTRRFRNAWRRNGNGIKIDEPHARQIVIDGVREERNRRLAESDADKARLDDVGTEQEKKAAKDKRQKLRDLPAVVASEIAIMTVEQLESYSVSWPT